VGVQRKTSVSICHDKNALAFGIMNPHTGRYEDSCFEATIAPNHANEGARF
jgi:hypothetical protein